MLVPVWAKVKAVVRVVSRSSNLFILGYLIPISRKLSAEGKAKLTIIGFAVNYLTQFSYVAIDRGLVVLSENNATVIIFTDFGDFDK